MMNCLIFGNKKFIVFFMSKIGLAINAYQELNLHGAPVNMKRSDS